ncbi:PREDICTED: splicing factor, suppressor of white-apricot homolog, partial [Myotis brandtii]|uniref:splicing factor, suppressor of white-apricot homolog n=1 Tax=Myotis brandtii TaxID=109478 RepID=UPI00070473CD
FEFLQPWHQYNPYYEFKKQFFLQKEGGDGAQAVSAPEEAPAESAPEKPSDTGEEGVAEDVADTGGRGGPGGKKESASGKAAPDGKLVKGTLPGLPGVPDVRTRRVGLSQGPRDGLAACSAGQGPSRMFQGISLGLQSLIDMQTLSPETAFSQAGLRHSVQFPLCL